MNGDELAEMQDIVRFFESQYGLSSDEVLKRHQAGEVILGLPDYDRQAWLSFYRELGGQVPIVNTDRRLLRRLLRWVRRQAA